MSFDREGPNLHVRMTKAPPQTTLRSPDGKSAAAQQDGVAEIRVALPPVEIGIPAGLPLPGAATGQLKVLNQHADQHSLTLELEALGGSVFELPIRRNGMPGVIHADGATVLRGSLTSSVPTIAAAGFDELRIVFPPSIGYEKATVHLSW